jgi:clan AA aspartic protease
MALESGRVNSYREALVLVHLGDGAAIECVVDTGFDGGLMLPRAFFSQIQIPIIGELTFEMVGGAKMSAKIGLTDIQWLGELREVEVIVSEGDDALIGTELLIATTLTIDYSSSNLTISTHANSTA